VNIDFWVKYKLVVFLPVLLCGFACLLRSLKSIRNSVNLRLFRFQWDHLASVLQWLLVAFYTSCLSNTLSVFNCQLQPNGLRTLKKDGSVVCFQSTWANELPTIALALLLYLVVAPIATIWLFYKHRNDHRSREFVQVYGLLISPYSNDCYYWECVVILKRVLFVTTAEFLTSNNYYASMSILMFFLWIEAVKNPYNSSDANMLNMS
jgi:hypothetical protein